MCKKSYMFHIFIVFNIYVAKMCHCFSLISPTYSLPQYPLFLLLHLSQPF